MAGHGDDERAAGGWLAGLWGERAAASTTNRAGRLAGHRGERAVAARSSRGRWLSGHGRERAATCSAVCRQKLAATAYIKAEKQVWSDNCIAKKITPMSPSIDLVL